MKRIELRGVIVGGEYDADWVQPYIEKGILTPESRIRAAIAEAAESNEEIELYVNSPGGYCHAGFEIINALTDFSPDGQKISLVIGAAAYSMAANLVLLTPAKSVKAHSNSLVMFHGAWGVTEGGKGAHEDYAALLDTRNELLKRSLAARGFERATVEDWFSEGRMGWLDAATLLDKGLVDTLIDDKAAQYASLAASDIGDFSEQGLNLAAFAFAPKDEGEATEDAQEIETDKTGEDVTQETAEETTEADTVEETKQSDDPTLNGLADQLEKAQAFGRKMQSEKDKAVAVVETKLNAEMDALKKLTADEKATLESKVAELSGDVEKAREEIEAKAKAVEAADKARDEANNELNIMAQRLTRLTAGALANDSEPVTWNEAMHACGGDYVAARKAYPQLLKQAVDQANAATGSKPYAPKA